MYWYFLALVLVSAAAALWLVRGGWGRRQWQRRFERARAALPQQAPELQQQLRAGITSAGELPGLDWHQAEFCETALLARDRLNGSLYALVGVMVLQEVAEHAEAVPPAGRRRCVTALLQWGDGRWAVAGRALFDMEPRTALERYARHVEAIDQVRLSSH